MPRRRQMKKSYGTYSQGGGGFYQTAVNYMFGSDLGPDERHSIMRRDDGSWYPASYNGPKTKLLENLRNNKKPINLTDEVSMYHDLRYSLAKNPDDVRKADLHMIRKIEQGFKDKSDYQTNLYTGYLPIKAKILAEDLGIMKPGSFAGLTKDRTEKKKKKYTDEEFDYLKSKLAEGEQKGFGKKGGGKKTKRPLTKWQLHVKAVKAKNRGKSFTAILKLASASYKKK